MEIKKHEYGAAADIIFLWRKNPLQSQSLRVCILILKPYTEFGDGFKILKEQGSAFSKRFCKKGGIK